MNQLKKQVTQAFGLLQTTYEKCSFVIFGIFSFLTLLPFVKKLRKKLPFFKINYQNSSKVLIYHKDLGYGNPWQ